MDKKKIRHFTIEDRREIEDMLAKNYSIRRMATRLGKSPAAVCKEIQRNKRSKTTHYGKPNSYEAEVADNKAHLRRKEASRRHKKIQGNPELCTFIKKSLLELQSPSAISGRLATGLVEGFHSAITTTTSSAYYLTSIL